MYSQRTKEELNDLFLREKEQYQKHMLEGLKLDLSRGKPNKAQLDLSLPLLEITDYQDDTGLDCRNYGGLVGLAEMRRFWSAVTGVAAENIVVGGNSSLNMMFDALTRIMLFGTHLSPRPWCKETNIKFLCPAPGYDRHFRVTETLGFELITVPMTPTGPDMGMVEEMVQDPTVKGIWCVPKYANPTGVSYSEETVKRLASMQTAAPDFIIMWDNAYAIHDFTDEGDHLLNIFEEAKKYGNEDRILYFASTSKVTFSGAGVAMMAMSDRMLAHNLPILGAQTIGPDKMNQLRHLRFLPDVEALKEQMRRHAALIAPKFRRLEELLEQELGGTGLATWTHPNGGYFISLDVPRGCAKRVYELCKEAGLTLTEAGATFPYGRDPRDSNLRLAPTFCTMEEMEKATMVLTCAVRLAALEKLLAE